MTDLRDHNKPCEHVNDGVAFLYEPGTNQEWWGCTHSSCPGGREVAIDYESHTIALNDDLRRALGKGKFAPFERDIARLLDLAAAIEGDTG